MAEAMIGTKRLTNAARAAKTRGEIDMITWGRAGWMQVDRLCRAAKRKIEELPIECKSYETDGSP